MQSGAGMLAFRIHYPSEVAMPETRFCYCCQRHHPIDQMCLFRTSAGYRWRCVSSIEAAGHTVQERDSFGRQQTALNRESSRRAAEFISRLRPWQIGSR